jgi:hypothetical protein
VLSIRVVFAAVSLVLAIPSAARAAPPSSVRDAGTAGFGGDLTQLATNGHRTYVAGEFGLVSAPSGGDALVSADTGRVLTTWPDSYGFTAAVPDGSGGWFAASYSGIVRHLLPGGGIDAGFSTPDFDDIKSIALSPDGGTLWVAGKFLSAGDQPRSGVAALRASDGSLLPWKPEGGNAGWSVVATADTVYVAGSIYPGGSDYSLAAFDAHTGAIRQVAVPGTDDDWGNHVALSPDGQTLYTSFVTNFLGGLTGAFDPATLTPRWTLKTGKPPVGMAPAGGRLYLTGVGSVGDQARDGAISVDAATGTPTDWFVPGMGDGIAVSPDGAEAYFTRGQVAGWPWQGAIAASTADGALLPWTPSGTSLLHARTPVMSPDGNSVLLWNLASGARTRAGAAMLDETGTVTTWVDPVDRQGRLTRVSSAAMDAAGTTYTTQMPESSNTGPRSVEAVDAAGALRFSLALDGEATATLSPDQQTLYVVGTFTSIGGVARPGLAAVRTSDGSLVSWPLTVAGGAVSQMVFSPDGATMYLAGTFTAVNDSPRTRVAAVDAHTGAVLPFNPAPDRVPGLAVSPDGTVVYLYGDFEHVAGRAQPRLAGVRVADGALVFSPSTEYNVFGVVALPDGRTVVTSIDSPSRPVDSWDAVSGQELSFGQNVGRGSVAALALDPDGQTLHIAGSGIGYQRFAIGRGSAPVNMTPPRVVGDARAYQWVECDPGTWNGHPAAYEYAWMLDGEPVAGFSGREFLLQAGDEGRALRCSAGAGSASATSAPVTVTPGEPFMFPPPRRTAGPAPTPTVSTTPTATASPEPDTAVQPSLSASHAAETRVDRTPPHVTLRRIGRTARVRLSETASARISLRRCRGRTCHTTTRKLDLGTGERILARGLAKGRYTLTVRATDAHRNTATKVLRFTL